MPISTVEEALEITLAKPIKKIKKDILPKDKSSEAEVLSFASRAISLINPEHFGHQVLPKKQRSDFSNRNAKRRFSLVQSCLIKSSEQADFASYFALRITKATMKIYFFL